VMDCSKARQWMSPYLDSELEQATTFEISEHLRVCENCRRRFDAERQVEGLVRGALQREAMPDAVWSRLRAHVNRLSLWRRLKIPGIFAAAAAIVIAAVALPMSGWLGPDKRAVTIRWDEVVQAPLPPGAALGDDEIQQALQSRYGLALSTDRKDTAGHPVQIIGGTPVVFGNREAYQVHVRCCGRPAVITLLHKADVAALPAEVKRLAGEALIHSVKRDGVNVRVLKVGDVESFIASEHYLDGLVHTLHPGRV